MLLNAPQTVAARTVTLDTTPPSGSFDAAPVIGATSQANGTSVTMTGTDADSGGSGVASVAIFNGVTKLGDATLGNGTWSFAATLKGDFSKLNAVIADAVGNMTTVTSLYRLSLGIAGQAYAAVDTIRDGNNRVVTQNLYDAAGNLYLGRTVTYQGGGKTNTFSGGSFFTGLNYASFDNVYDASGNLIGADYFDAGGNKTIQQAFGITGQPYTSTETYFGITGQPRRSSTTSSRR